VSNATAAALGATENQFNAKVEFWFLGNDNL
jgi:hypothetical protein